ncbi:MAG: methionine adenosyltransferase domain-containing protein [Nitrospinota bacterium]
MTNRIHAAEFVFPGHPDKLADAIADALVQEASRRERRALVGVEVAVHRNKVFITGRIACEGAMDIDIAGLVREVYRTAGYGDAWYPAPDEIEIDTDLCLGPLEVGEAEYRALSDDQSICTGFAVKIPETNYLPIESWLANRLGRHLSGLRDENPDLQLGPDGKVAVLVSEHEDSWRLEGFTCSLQQKEGADDLALHRAVRVSLEEKLASLAEEFPGLVQDVPEKIFVNGAGNFDVGGPEGDNGLSGKKLVVDAYGTRVPIGGGALSGKDFYKVDRAGALHARRVAKAAVLTGTARQALVKLIWYPGDSQARLFLIENESGDLIDSRPWKELFDLSLESSGDAWTGCSDLIHVARYGHFTNAEIAWENIRIAPVKDRNNPYQNRRQQKIEKMKSGESKVSL